MAITRNQPRPAPTSPAPKDGAAPSAPPAGTIEEIGLENAEVVSMGHIESFAFSIEGEIYDAWMPRIARQADGLVPVLPCRRIEDGKDCLLIVPGAFNSWLRRNQPRRGTRLRLLRRGVDEASGAWKLAVERL
jgi:hypothetical protein